MHVFIITIGVFAVVVSLVLFTQLKYVFRHLFVINFLTLRMRRKGDLVKLACKQLGYSIYPVLQKHELKQLKLNDLAFAFEFDAWKDVTIDGKGRFSIENGVNIPVVGQPDLWGKSPFFDPRELERYNLWYGFYLIPVDNVYKYEDGQKEKYTVYGYDPLNDSIDFDHLFILIYWDLCAYFMFAKGGKVTAEERRDILKMVEFKDQNARVESRSENTWFVEGKAKTASYMRFKNDLLHPPLFFQAFFGWSPKSSKLGEKESWLKGDLVVTYRDKQGNVVHPKDERAELLSVGYVFSGIRSDVENGTSSAYLDELKVSLMNTQFGRIAS